MIKNIILDVGGVMFDDSKENASRVLNKDASFIYKKAYGGGFKKSLLGEITVSDVIENLKDDADYKDIKFLLSKENLHITYPIIQKNFDYIMSLRNNGYRIFLLTNITEDSYNYINEKVDISKSFDGGIYSYQENLVKPDPQIFELIINTFNLNKEETIFFDDKEKNVLAAINCGIKAVVFKNIEDIKSNL